MEDHDMAYEQILLLIETCRYLAAFEEYEKLMLALGASIVTPDVRKQMEDRLEKDEKIQQMLQRTPMIKKSLHSVDTSDDWTLGANMFGILTHYKKCEDDPTSIIVKIEGTLDDLPLFEQMAVIHEIDLFKEWAPFCTNSVLVDKIGKAELFGYVCVGLPFFSRDVLVHAFGADCMEEHGKVVILGKSAENYTHKEVPWKPVGWTHNRMYMKDLEAIVEAVSPTAARTKIIARVDLNAPLPTAVINFLIRKLAGILLYVIQKQVMKVQTDHQCSHALRIRSNLAFYRDWLLPKLRHYCDLKHWEQPTINSLGEDGKPPARSSSSSSTEPLAADGAAVTGNGSVAKSDLVMAEAMERGSPGAVPEREKDDSVGSLLRGIDVMLDCGRI